MQSICYSTIPQVESNKLTSQAHNPSYNASTQSDCWTESKGHQICAPIVIDSPLYLIADTAGHLISSPELSHSFDAAIPSFKVKQLPLETEYSSSIEGGGGFVGGGVTTGPSSFGGRRGCFGGEIIGLLLLMVLLVVEIVYYCWYLAQRILLNKVQN